MACGRQAGRAPRHERFGEFFPSSKSFLVVSASLEPNPRAIVEEPEAGFVRDDYITRPINFTS
jgi:hypothetical protein